MDLVKSWAAAIVVYLLGSALTVYVAGAAKATREDLASTGGAITWNLVPTMLIFLFVTGLGALVHDKAKRDDATRHALAAFAVPAVFIVVTVVVGLAQGSVIGVVAGLVGSLIGTGAGWTAERWWRGRSPSTPAKTGDGYF